MSLPMELYRIIIDDVEDEADLFPLLHASSMMRGEAQRRLYRTIAVGQVRGRDIASEKVVRRWIDSVDVIGKFIRQLDLSLWYPDDVLWFEGDIKFFELVAAAYDGMINLKELTLPCITMGGIMPPVSAPFQLLYFYAQVYIGDDSETIFSEKFLPFLESQPTIRELNLPCDTTHPLLPSILPNLSILASKPSLAFRLLPGRPITHLFLYYSALQNPMIDDIKGLMSIRSMSFDNMESLELFKYSFAVLEFLELEVDSVEDLVSSLSRMPRLFTLRLVAAEYYEGYYNSDSTTTLQLELVAQLFRTVPSLQILYMSRGGYWPCGGEKVDVWRRDKVVATEAAWQEHAWKLV